jgi:uroporphyrinogen III methyltransferase / synthase
VTVYLVGAGPGDPGLLTRRGAALLAEADVVVYDRLVEPSLLELCRSGATLIDVGKSPGEGTGSSGRSRQDEINDLLIEHARHAPRVVRLKGGDPYLFGRGGEEAEALQRAGVVVEVVPGVPSAFAVPATAGIPVTYRGLAGAVSVVAGQGGEADGDGAVDWEALAAAGGTVVVLMGVAKRAEIAARLMAGGRPASTPVAVIERGTTPQTRARRTSLGELGELGVEAPATLVIGPVAALDLRSGFGPLEGATVAVTRVETRGGLLAVALAAAGAQVLSVPLIETVDADDGGAALEAAARNVAAYDWVVFTSATAVERFLPALGDLRELATVRLAAVGPATAEALTRHQLRADLVPSQASAAALAAAMPAGNGRVLFPSARHAGPDLAEGLVAKGWSVVAVEAYATQATARPHPSVLERLGEADAITFTSPSSVAACGARSDGPDLPVPHVAACIGAKTAAKARELGFSVVLEATEASAEGLVQVLVEHWRTR